MGQYVKPAALVFQEYTIQSSELVEALRAHISGPNVRLHRFSKSDEKANIAVGLYDHVAGLTAAWPDRAAGSKVKTDSVRVIIENALLMYFEDTIGVSSGGRGTVQRAAGYNNRITSSAVTFRAVDGHSRSALLHDRDVAVGDIVYLRSVTGDDCEESELWTRVVGFATTTEASVVGEPTADDNNATDTSLSVTISQTAGATNCVTATADGSEYDGLAAGRISETYTITVVKSGVAGCEAARLRIVSASGTDNVAEVTPSAYGEPTEIGTRGLTVTFDNTLGDCSVSASVSDVVADELVIGQTWTVTVRQAHEAACMLANDTFTGSFDDTYILEVTKGGKWATGPQVTVTTARGLDVSGPTTVDLDEDFSVGIHGLTAQFTACSSPDPEGLRLGDKFYIAVESGTNGPTRTLILRDDLPDGMRAASDLDLRLFISKTIDVSKNRLSSPPEQNFTLEDTQVVVADAVTHYDSTWTAAGTQLPLVVWSGREADLAGPEFGRVYVEYSEYLTEMVGTVRMLDGVADLDLIPGQLDVENPLKWAAYRALQNSNGSLVAVTAVSDPEDLDAWQLVIDAVDGRDDIYNFVPLTRNRAVLDLFQAHVETESSPDRGNWKGMFVSLSVDPVVMLVGKSSESAQLLRPTSTDGDAVMATLSDNPQASGSQYTLLRVPANNAGFVTYGVRAGDTVRFLFSIDAFGVETYKTFTVDRVLSESSLLLLTGHSVPVTLPQRVEVHRTRNKNELAAAIGEQAASYADHRVVAVWPDIVGTGGIVQQGYHLCAAIAGLISGVAPHQGLTNVEIVGFDDVAARTRDFFSRSQLDSMAAQGVWIVTEDAAGTPHTRHALTTSLIDLNRQEEMVRRNLDSISYAYLAQLRPLIGRSNVTPQLLTRVDFLLTQTSDALARSSVATLGGQLISAAVRVDASGARLLRIHPLAADRIEIVLDLVLPAPLNNAELRLVV